MYNHGIPPAFLADIQGIARTDRGNASTEFRRMAGLDDPATRDAETAAAGLVKGLTACARSSCQTALVGVRWWNSSTRAFYCGACAVRINQGAGYELCILELIHPEPDEILVVCDA